MVSGFPPIHLNIVRLRENYVKHGWRFMSDFDSMPPDVNI